MTDSILYTVKKQLGVYYEDSNDFDDELIIYINTVFMVLNQLGISSKDNSKVFRIKDSSTAWVDFLEEDHPYFESVKDYICTKTKVKFDPPASSVLLESLNKTLAELEWRFTIHV